MAVPGMPWVKRSKKTDGCFDAVWLKFVKSKASGKPYPFFFGS